MIDKEQLRMLQLTQLKIAKEFKRICDKHNIQYSLSAGSLLGAVRHSGFIPWDDDFDIEMLRCEYEHFLQVAPNELQDEFFLETWNTDPHFAFPYAKLMLKKTIYAEKISENVDINKGIFIDIFIADSVSDNPRARKLQCCLCDNLVGILYEKNHYLSESKQMNLKNIIKKIGSILPLKILQSWLLSCMTHYNKTTARDISLFGSCIGSLNEIRAKVLYDDLIEYNFEDTSFKGFREYDKYLSDLYGDYMQFPPEEERYNRHGILNLDFGPY